jgi:CheY-like chemotaxis protein
MQKLAFTIIEDNKAHREQIKEHCNALKDKLGLQVTLRLCKSLEEFRRQKSKPDVLIVDLRLGHAGGDRSGWEAVRAALGRKVVPVIVYSAFAGEGVPDELENLLVVPVKKGAGNFQNVLEKASLLKARLNQEWDRVQTQMESLTLETVGHILGKGTEVSIEAIDENTLACLALARLASYLMNTPSGKENKFPPESIFIVPPLQLSDCSAESLLLGDILEEKQINGSKALWLVVAPSCDLLFGQNREAKVENVLVLRCYRSHSEVPFLKAKGLNERKNSLKDRSREGTAKLLRCPTQVFGSKYFLLSFKEYATVRYDAIIGGLRNHSWRKMATLATPYAESVQNLLVRDVSRIGTPDTASRKDDEKWAEAFCSDGA